MRGSFSRGSLALVVVLLSLPAFAAEGRIPIWFPNATTPGPYVIGVPGGEGKYILTRNIDANFGPGPAIVVAGLCGVGNEGAVEIDLNGFTIFANVGGGPVIDVDCLESVVIRNGSIEPPPGLPSLPFGFGVDVAEVDKVVIEDLNIRGTGDTGIAVYLPGRSFAIRRNLIRDVNFPAIYVDTSGAGIGGTGSIEHNVISDTGGGIDVSAFANVISSLTIRGNNIETTSDPGFGWGIHLVNAHSFLVIENTIEESFLDGIYLENCSAGKIVNNTVHHAGNGGLFPRIHGIALVIGNGNLFLDNVSSENGVTVGVPSDGLHVDGVRNVVRGNVLVDNGGFGLHFHGLPAGGATPANFNTYDQNTARGNGLVGPVCGAFVPGDDGFCLTPGGSFPPDFCNEEPFISNASHCTNFMPGPPQS